LEFDIHATGSKGWLRVSTTAVRKLLNTTGNFGVKIQAGAEFFSNKPIESQFVRLDLKGLDPERIKDFAYWLMSVVR
jgi:hypothetical protein